MARAETIAVAVHLTKVEPAAAAKDLELAARLWAVSQQLTGVRYDALAN